MRIQNSSRFLSIERIKKAVREIVGLVFRFSGIPMLIRNIFCRNKVTIIFYHNPKPEVFKRHIEYLSKHYNFISLNILIDALYEKNWSIIPKKSLVITIDDGHKGNYLLLSLIKKHNLNPTIYLCSHIINTNRKFWFYAENKNIRYFKEYKNKYRLKVLKERNGYEQIKEYPDRQSLNLKEIREMMPHVDFQSHSRFHPILINCSDKESREEIVESKRILEKLLIKKIYHFSFPNGDYSEREIKYLKNCGYKSARTLDIGWNDVNTDPYRLKAMVIEDDASINILCVQIIGLFRYFNYFLHGSFNGRHPAYL